MHKQHTVLKVCNETPAAVHGRRHEQLFCPGTTVTRLLPGPQSGTPGRDGCLLSRSFRPKKLLTQHYAPHGGPRTRPPVGPRELPGQRQPLALVRREQHRQRRRGRRRRRRERRRRGRRRERVRERRRRMLHRPRRGARRRGRGAPQFQPARAAQQVHPGRRACARATRGERSGVRRVCASCKPSSGPARSRTCRALPARPAGRNVRVLFCSAPLAQPQKESKGCAKE